MCICCVCVSAHTVCMWSTGLDPILSFGLKAPAVSSASSQHQTKIMFCECLLNGWIMTGPSTLYQYLGRGWWWTRGGRKIWIKGPHSHCSGCGDVGLSYGGHSINRDVVVLLFQWISVMIETNYRSQRLRNESYKAWPKLVLYNTQKWSLGKKLPLNLIIAALNNSTLR